MNPNESLIPAQARINGASEPVQVHPGEVAQAALNFLQRCTLSPAERQYFGFCEQMLLQIAKGELTVAPADKPQEH